MIALAANVAPQVVSASVSDDWALGVEVDVFLALPETDRALASHLLGLSRLYSVGIAIIEACWPRKRAGDLTRSGTGGRSIVTPIGRTGPYVHSTQHRAILCY